MVEHSYWSMTPMPQSRHPSTGVSSYQGFALWQLCYHLALSDHLISLGKANICILSAEEARQPLVFPEDFSDMSPGIAPNRFQLFCAAMQER